MQQKMKKKEGEENRVKATIVVENDLWKEFKKLAIDKELRISELLQELVSSYIKNDGKIRR